MYIQVINDLEETMDVHFRHRDATPLPSSPIFPPIASGEGVFLPLEFVGKASTSVFVRPAREG